MATFVVTTKYLPGHDEERMAARPAHREWLGKLRDEGRLVNAGPFADQRGALLIFEEADEEALRATLAQDPYPADSVEVTLHGEWSHLYPFK